MPLKIPEVEGWFEAEHRLGRWIEPEDHGFTEHRVNFQLGRCGCNLVCGWGGGFNWLVLLAVSGWGVLRHKCLVTAFYCCAKLLIVIGEEAEKAFESRCCAERRREFFELIEAIDHFGLIGSFRWRGKTVAGFAGGNTFLKFEDLITEVGCDHFCSGEGVFCCAHG